METEENVHQLSIIQHYNNAHKLVTNGNTISIYKKEQTKESFRIQNQSCNISYQYIDTKITKWKNN